MKIALIGMPATGKSTIASLFINKETPVIDTDALIVEKIKSTLQNFIDKFGEKSFLDLENSVLCELSIPNNCIISTGGSVIYSVDGMFKMKQDNVKFVYLRTSIDILESRLAGQESIRGVVMNGFSNWRELMIDRDSRYLNYANYIIDCDNKTPVDIFNGIVKISSFDIK